MNKENINGVWIGENAVVSLTNKLQIVFLRLNCDNIICIVKNEGDEVVAVVYGYQSESGSFCEKKYIKGEDNSQYLELHALDEILISGNTLNYKMYDGTSFACILGEKIILSETAIKHHNTAPDMSIAQKLESWNLGVRYECGDDSIIAQIDTRKYSIDFRHFKYGNLIYCRVGINGYCEKGYALLSTVCLRDGTDPEGKASIKKEVRMLENNLDSLNDYIPNLDYFSDSGCVVFPTDGGWYWSIKEVADDYISLYSCGGEESVRSRNRDGLYEVII